MYAKHAALHVSQFRLVPIRIGFQRRFVLNRSR